MNERDARAAAVSKGCFYAALIHGAVVALCFDGIASGHLAVGAVWWMRLSLFGFLLSGTGFFLLLEPRADERVLSLCFWLLSGAVLLVGIEIMYLLVTGPAEYLKSK